MVLWDKHTITLEVIKICHICHLRRQAYCVLGSVDCLEWLSLNLSCAADEPGSDPRQGPHQELLGEEDSGRWGALRDRGDEEVEECVEKVSTCCVCCNKPKTWPLLPCDTITSPKQSWKNPHLSSTHLLTSSPLLHSPVKIITSPTCSHHDLPSTVNIITSPHLLTSSPHLHSPVNIISPHLLTSTPLFHSPVNIITSPHLLTSPPFTC